MTVSTAEAAHFVLGLALMLGSAHGMGALFRMSRQPAVVGEIVGGLVLGPSVLGMLLPEFHGLVFGHAGTSGAMLGAISQLGLLLLMFCSGVDVGTAFPRGQRVTTVLVTLSGTLLPFLVGLLVVQQIEVQQFLGGARSRTAFVLVFAAAIAVTSIPVIARIFLDLGILDTNFARIVIGAAVIEDVALYVILGIALSIAGAATGSAFGLPAILELHGASTSAFGYHVVVNFGFITLASTAGPWLLTRARLGKVADGTLVLVVLLATCSLGLWLGVALIYSAFVVGIAVGAVCRDSGSLRSIREFAFAFLVPVYFASVGASLDLVHHFEPTLFFLFLVGACAVKASSVYLGARLAGESRVGAGNIAVAMNARGGPGIVLASVAYNAGVIAETFYVVLVLLAIVTSLMAGAWLDFVVRNKWALR